MYAVVEIQGFDIKVKKGEKIKIPKIEAKEGEEIVLEKVKLLRHDDKLLLGNPYIENVKVRAKVLRHFKDKKVIVFKFRKRKRYRVKRGYRSQKSEIEILGIEKNT